VVVILDLQYETMTKARVSVLVGDHSAGAHWTQRSEIFHDDALNLNQQPTGQVGLYFSDILGLGGLPTDFRRPSIAELSRGIKMFVLPSCAA
jgi:hypothetical protein